MKHLHLKTLGVAQLAYLFLSSAAVAGPLPNGTYSDTDFGTVEITCTEAGYWNCTATYEEGQSFLFVDRNAVEGQYFGYWAEPESDTPCDTIEDFGEIRTDAWGQLEMSFDTQSESWEGSWSYCDEPLTYAFDGTRGAQTEVETAKGSLTAQGVWDSWTSLFAATPGFSSAARLDITDGSLIISDYTLARESQNDSLSISISEIVLTEIDDGSVAVTMSDVYSLSLLNGANDNRIELTVSQPDMEFVVSGIESNMSYRLSAPTTDITLEAPGSNAITLDLTLLGFSGGVSYDQASGLSLESFLNLETMNFDINFAHPDTGQGFLVNGSLAGFASSIQGNLGSMLAGTTIEQGLSADFTVAGNISHGAVSYNTATIASTPSFASNGEIASGMLNLEIDEGQLSTSGGFNGVALALSGSDMPFPPINAALDESAFNFIMPLSKSDFPSEFAMLVRLVGLSANENIWGIFDPAGVLPRDPATLVLDFSGMGNWLINIFAPDGQETMSGGMMGMIRAASLNELILSAAGSELTGKGNFTFDYSDMTTFGGLPKPTGAANLQLIGGNGLLDKLIAMGLVPEEQAMGARMMMGLFATMVVGSEDTITTEIVIEEDGSIFANGQRLQ
jgi:hypothetical protein